MTTTLIIIAWYLSGIVSTYAIFKYLSSTDTYIDDDDALFIMTCGLFGPAIALIAIIFWSFSCMGKLIQLADRWISK